MLGNADLEQVACSQQSQSGKSWEVRDPGAGSVLIHDMTLNLRLSSAGFDLYNEGPRSVIL